MITTITAFLLLLAAAMQSSFKPGQNVILKAPTGYERWVLSDTCTIAFLLATNEKYRATIADKIKAAQLDNYNSNTQAVIQEMDEDGYCAWVETVPDKSSGWIYKDLMELTVAEKNKVASQTRAAEAKRQAEQGRLESLPRLVSSADSVIVAVDDGCFKDVKNLKTLGGIDLRKRLAELVLYKCAFLVPSGTRVEANKLGDNAYRVVVQDGSAKGRAGIVGAEFVRR